MDCEQNRLRANQTGPLGGGGEEGKQTGHLSTLQTSARINFVKAHLLVKDPHPLTERKADWEESRCAKDHLYREVNNLVLFSSTDSRFPSCSLSAQLLYKIAGCCISASLLNTCTNYQFLGLLFEKFSSSVKKNRIESTSSTFDLRLHSCWRLRSQADCDWMWFESLSHMP